MGEQANEVPVFFVVTREQARSRHHGGLRVHVFKAASPRVRQLEHNRVFSPRRDAEESVVLLDDLLHVILEHSQPLWIWFVTTAVPDLEVVRSTVHNPCDWSVGIDFHDAVKKGVSVGRAEGPPTPPVALFALLEGGQLSGSVPGFRCVTLLSLFSLAVYFVSLFTGLCMCVAMCVC